MNFNLYNFQAIMCAPYTREAAGFWLRIWRGSGSAGPELATRGLLSGRERRLIEQSERCARLSEKWKRIVSANNHNSSTRGAA